MKYNVAIISAALLLGVASSATANGAINVSCYRGPWEAVIWDRANPKFVESLETYGYSNATAGLLADSICRNPSLVDHPDWVAPAVRAMLAATPKDG